jgi:hypothetical protein
MDELSEQLDVTVLTIPADRDRVVLCDWKAGKVYIAKLEREASQHVHERSMHDHIRIGRALVEIEQAVNGNS